MGGRCRGWKSRVYRTPAVMSPEGRETSGGVHSRAKVRLRLDWLRKGQTDSKAGCSVVVVRGSRTTHPVSGVQPKVVAVERHASVSLRTNVENLRIQLALRE
jgi:hypothetical protein